MDTEKASLILGHNWSDCLLPFRKILNPAKPYFINFTVKCESEVNDMIDHDGIPSVRKGIIRSSLALNTNGSCEIYRSSGFPVPLPLTGVPCVPSVKVIKKQVHCSSALSVRNYSWNDLND